MTFSFAPTLVYFLGYLQGTEVINFPSSYSYVVGTAVDMSTINSSSYTKISIGMDVKFKKSSNGKTLYAVNAESSESDKTWKKGRTIYILAL